MTGFRKLQHGDRAALVLSVLGDHSNSEYSMHETAVHQDDAARFIAAVRINPCVSAWIIRSFTFNANFKGDHK